MIAKQTAKMMRAAAGYQLSLAIEIVSRAVSHPPATATRARARNPHVLGAYFASEGQTGYQRDPQQPALHDSLPYGADPLAP